MDSEVLFQKTEANSENMFWKRSKEVWIGPVLRNERLMVLLQVWERARTEGEKRESPFLQRRNKTTCSNILSIVNIIIVDIFNFLLAKAQQDNVLIRHHCSQHI